MVAPAMSAPIPAPTWRSRWSKGGLVTSVLVSILIANSYFAEGNIYEISPEKAVAGIILGIVIFLVNLYFLVSALNLAGWRD